MAYRADVRPEDVHIPAGHPLARLPWIAGGVGLAALIAAFALGLGAGGRFYASYLLAYLYWLTLALGALFFVLVQHASRAGWSVTVRRLAEQVAATLPLFALLFVPVALGLHDLFHWSHGEAVAADPLLAGKSAFLNPGFFYLRAVVYFVCWGSLGVWLWRRSLAQDHSRDPAITRRLQSASAPALIVFALTVTFAAFDWIMSLDPHWYSTVFGVYVFAGSVVAILAFLILLVLGLKRGGLLAGLVDAEHFHDLGKLLFAFVVFWAYIAFSQFMLIWYGNIPEETIWYRHRLEGGWYWATVLLAVGHFAIPFFFLLPRDVKRRRLPLAAGALWMLAVHYLDLYWLVMPVFDPGGAASLLLDLLTFVGIGGLFCGALGWVLTRSALVPLGDPRLPESLTFENM